MCCILLVLETNYSNCYSGTYDKEVKRMVCLQNSRFLETTSPLRKDCTFPNNKLENRSPPSVRDYSEDELYMKLMNELN